MEQDFQKYVYEFFLRLIEQYGFSKERELNDGLSYSIEFYSTTFVIKLEKYRTEFYPTLYKINDSNRELNLFNLLSYLNGNSANIP